MFNYTDGESNSGFLYQDSVNKNWGGDANCTVEIRGPQQEVMITLLYAQYHGNTLKKDSCSSNQPYVIQNARDLNMTSQGAMTCPTIDGITYHRWTTFMTNDSVKLLLRKGEWNPFQVNFTSKLAITFLYKILKVYRISQSELYDLCYDLLIN